MATTPPTPPRPEDDDVSAPQEQEEQPGASDQDTNPSTSSAASKKKKKRKKKKGGGGEGGGGSGIGDGSPQAAGASTFRMQQDAVAGRCVVASRSLQPGGLVLEEPPFAKVMLKKVCSKRASEKLASRSSEYTQLDISCVCLFLLALRTSVSAERQQ